MTDIVKKLRGPIDEKEDYFISQWPGEEPKTHDAVRFQAANDIERLRAALEEIVRLDDEWVPETQDDYSYGGYEVCALIARAALEGK